MKLVYPYCGSITLTDSLRTMNRTLPRMLHRDVSPWSSAQTFPFHQTLGLTSTDKSHYTNHMKQTEPIVQNVPQWLSKVRLARFARFLRRGMKTA
ncbi:hypothetical protein RHMOL_Rhmol06G0278100 [Rhododendron molle]|uniref:Uncharacterized protein n=1 Tax=Rhododendron molle TaxID=49168 RepID=A0ACC0NHV6_RHOML|nr:hypothetical protein RHMOL_Rhmol06G0278100 [Rhododendron molle]